MTDYNTFWVGLAPKLSVLDRKIERRLKERLAHGMIAEAKRLHASGLSYKRMEELGLEYRSLARLLKKEISSEELERELNSAIRRYARKQIGYWKRNPDIKWFERKESSKIASRFKDWLL